MANSGSRLLAGTGARTEAPLARGDLSVNGNEGLSARLAISGLSTQASPIRHKAINLTGLQTAYAFPQVATLTGGDEVVGGVVEWVTVDVLSDQRPLSGNSGSAIPVDRRPAVVACVRPRAYALIEDESGLREQAPRRCKRMIWKSEHARHRDGALSASTHLDIITHAVSTP
jgi:hypothetical protein